ncbi:MAG: hypothetical protein IT368_16195, partial [Candidatus Hydrogenedentes bacterium]|nr:hypothetical protein [Candidatus Hydrogenedentota bacterium]
MLRFMHIAIQVNWVCILLGARAVFAQEAEVPSPADLANVIERLEQRVNELEAEVSALKAQQAPPVAPAAEEAPIEARVAEIERKLEEAPAPDTFRAYWNDALRFETADGAFKFRVGGRLQLDAGWLTADDELERAGGDLEDQVEFRRARILLGATLYDDYFFEAEYDFAGGDPEFKDVVMGMENIPYAGTLTLGHRKEPFSMEAITSDNFTTFMERSLIDSFTPERNTGITLQNTLFDRRATWAAGIYLETDDFGDGGTDGGYNLTARVTGLPLYRDEGRKLIHIGSSYSHRNPDGLIRYRARPEMHLVDTRYVDTGEFYADDIDIFGAEAAVQYGWFALQGEYIRTDVDRPYRHDPTFDGWYLYGSALLTGEYRP